MAYTDSLHDAGLLPLILPVLPPESAAVALNGASGLVLTGGEDLDPSRYRQRAISALGDVHEGRDLFELELVHAARQLGLPVLAICRGIQLLNVALGGTLVQDIPSQWPHAIAHDGAPARDDRSHEIRADTGSRLAVALGAERLRVNSFHHQALDALADGLVATAHAPDGIIEGVEWRDEDWWVLGVQWHPEELSRTDAPWDRALFAAFADQCSRRQRASVVT